MGLTVDDTSYVAIVIGVVVPVVVFLGALAWVCLIRNRRRGSLDSNYTQVEHQLDEEEIEFKRFIESQGARDDIDELFSEESLSLSLDDTTHDRVDPDSFTFDEEERNHLAILEKFRASLVGSSSLNPVSERSNGGNGKTHTGLMAEEPLEEVENPMYSELDEGADDPPDEIRT